MREVKDVDIAGDGVGWGRCLRIRVRIDLRLPLERERALNLLGKSHWVTFKYEKLPLFCFYCGRILHDVEGCPVRTGRRSEEKEKGWGAGLRAEAPKRSYGGGIGGGRTQTGASTAKEAQEEEIQSVLGRRGNHRNPNPSHTKDSCGIVGNSLTRKYGDSGLNQLGDTFGQIGKELYENMGRWTPGDSSTWQHDTYDNFTNKATGGGCEPMEKEDLVGINGTGDDMAGSEGAGLQ